MKTNSIKITLFFAVFAGVAATLLTSCAAAKPNNEGSSSQKTKIANVAVIETEMDVQSGVSKELTKSEVREITTELRRQAVKNLPKNKYNVMTEATVQAQGAAVLEKCFEENCLITLGSKIGADYIVRGTISKFQKRFTLSVEIYDTEDGNLIVSSDPVRSESIDKLLDASTTACADMYKTFIETHIVPENSKSEKKEKTPKKKEESDSKDEENKELLDGEDAYRKVFSENWYGFSMPMFPNIDDFIYSTLGFGFRADFSLSEKGPFMLTTELNAMYRARKPQEDIVYYDIQFLPLANYLLAPKEVRTTNLFGGEIGLIRSWYLEAGPMYGINSKNFGWVLGFGLRENATDNPFDSKVNGIMGIRLISSPSIQIGIFVGSLF
jgi:TolB-like protein